MGVGYKYIFWVIMIFVIVSCGPSEKEEMDSSRAMMQAGDFSSALTLLNEIIANNSTNQVAYNMRGIAKLELGEAEKAINDFDVSLALDSGNYRAYYNRANAYYQTENFNQSIIDYDRALRLEPKSVDLYINRGNALVQLDKYAEAVSDYKFALKIDRENYLTNFNLGRTYYLMDSLYLADVAFSRTAEIYPAFAPTYYFLGMIAMERDEMEKSCLLLQQASDLGYQQAIEVQKIYCMED